MSWITKCLTFSSEILSTAFNSPYTSMSSNNFLRFRKRTELYLGHMPTFSSNASLYTVLPIQISSSDCMNFAAHFPVFSYSEKTKETITLVSKKNEMVSPDYFSKKRSIASRFNKFASEIACSVKSDSSKLK